MASRKVTITNRAIEEVAHVAYFIEGEGLPRTAKKFVDEAFRFFEKLGDDQIVHKPCNYFLWKNAGYRCAVLKKKFIVAYQSLSHEVIVCDFALQKLLGHR